jgi:hypothetical protein
MKLRVLVLALGWCNRDAGMHLTAEPQRRGVPQGNARRKGIYARTHSYNSRASTTKTHKHVNTSTL